MTWSDDLKRERAEIERDKQALAKREENYQRREEDWEFQVSIAAADLEKITKQLNAAKARQTEVVVRDTKRVEVLRVDLVLGDRWLVFEIEVNEGGGEVRASLSGPVVIGQHYGTVSLSGFTPDFVSQHLETFLGQKQ